MALAQRRGVATIGVVFGLSIFAACSSGGSTPSTAKGDDGGQPVVVEGGGADAGPAVRVELSGNSFLTQQSSAATETIDDMSTTGLTGWTRTDSVVSTYVYVQSPGDLDISLAAAAATGRSSAVRVTALGKSFDLTLTGAASFHAGAVSVPSAGYVKIDLQGVSTTGASFGTATAFELRGAASHGLIFANDPMSYYWSRRGPSVHLSYTASAPEYFYGEVTVPTGEDKVGSYFMVNGFDNGYSGLQVISDTERWILFSVWDPAAGQTTLKKQGPAVTASRFDGEGTGGQSYVVFPWVAGKTYGFLTRAAPDGRPKKFLGPLQHQAAC